MKVSVHLLTSKERLRNTDAPSIYRKVPYHFVKCFRIKVSLWGTMVLIFEPKNTSNNVELASEEPGEQHD